MIEYIEGFGAEFEIRAFSYREMLDQRHVEIRAPGIAQNVSPGIAERESGRQHEHIRIVEKRTKSGEWACQRAT